MYNSSDVLRYINSKVFDYEVEISLDQFKTVLNDFNTFTSINRVLSTHGFKGKVVKIGAYFKYVS